MGAKTTESLREKHLAQAMTGNDMQTSRERLQKHTNHCKAIRAPCYMRLLASRVSSLT